MPRQGNEMVGGVADGGLSPTLPVKSVASPPGQDNLLGAAQTAKSRRPFGRVGDECHTTVVAAT